MKGNPDFSPLCQSFFSKRLVAQSKASPHTISAYAQTFRLLMRYAQKRLRTSPSELALAQLDAAFIAGFLDDLESSRSNSTRSRNTRLATLRSFYQYAALEAPQHAGLIQRVLAIPYKRTTRRLVPYLTRLELDALLSSVDKSTWIGRRTIRSRQTRRGSSTHMPFAREKACDAPCAASHCSHGVAPSGC